jgi:hypothetical protein
MDEPFRHRLLTTKKASNHLIAHLCCPFEDKWTVCVLPILEGNLFRSTFFFNIIVDAV